MNTHDIPIDVRLGLVLNLNGVIIALKVTLLFVLLRIKAEFESFPFVTSCDMGADVNPGACIGSLFPILDTDARVTRETTIFYTWVLGYKGEGRSNSISAGIKHKGSLKV